MATNTRPTLDLTGSVPVAAPTSAPAWWATGVAALDPQWCLEITDPPTAHERVVEALMALSNGTIGTRGSVEEPTAESTPLVVVTGVYDESADTPTLLPGPRWTSVDLGGRRALHDRRILDMRSGALWRHAVFADGEMHTLRFVSLARPLTAALRVSSTVPVDGPPLDVDGLPGANATVWEGCHLASTLASAGGSIAAACDETRSADGPRTTLERIVTFAAEPARPVSMREACDARGAATEVGFEGLLAEHRAAWADRWDGALVSIDGDPETERLVRLALFHVLGAAPCEGEAAVGARGLTGLSYAGHVFWDADVFVLPALAATLPEAARSMIEYRIRRLGAAEDRAALRGHPGASFPWESARTGDDVTPRGCVDQETGEFRAYLTGLQEEHITADVPWSMWAYAAWTGDDALLQGAGASVTIEAARYWTSRAVFDDAGAAHIRGVIGPDEYHEDVDDNAFTNVMARWTLRAAAALGDRHGRVHGYERARWLALADALVDGYDSGTGIYTEFSGFDELDPILISEMAEPPVAADLLLGREIVQSSQIVKQPDVLMLHHMVPQEVHPGSLVPNLEHYAPRTAHGSSLSPAIVASLMARADRADQALALFDTAARIDVEDLTGMTAGGIHLATMGGLWQAVALGFAGLSPGPTALRIEPHLPARWRRLNLRVQFRGVRVDLELEAERVTIRPDGEVRVALGAKERQIGSSGVTFTRTPEGWEVSP
jgi:trehalose/maltose hydrolase-like predicted phosphorylase